jgi:hypothetical protein
MKFDDYFQFPWVLDMGPYTAEGIIAEARTAAHLSLRSIQIDEMVHSYIRRFIVTLTLRVMN